MRVRKSGLGVALFVLLAGVAVAQDPLSACIDATCRVSAGEGRGTGCVFEVSNGYVYVLTCAHVVGRTSAVTCDFWSRGHQSSPIPGSVILAVSSSDVAIVAIPEANLGGRLPPAIPLAPAGATLQAGDTVISVGCANASWATAWRGHVLGYQGGDLMFIPPPSNGRSGSAVFSGDGQQIVGLLRARTGDNSTGIALPSDAIRQAVQRQASIPTGLTAGCPGGSCPASPPYPDQGNWRLLPYRGNIDDRLDSLDGRLRNIVDKPWPTLPPLSPVVPSTTALEALVGEHSKRLDRLEQMADAAQKAAAEAGTRAGDAVSKAMASVEGLNAVAGKLREVETDHFSWREKLAGKLESVPLAGSASSWVSALTGLSTTASFGIVAIVLVVVLVAVKRDVSNRRETGDPLAIEKLLGAIASRTSTTLDDRVVTRLDALLDRFVGQGPPAGKK